MAVRALYRRAQSYIRKNRSGSIRNALRAASYLPVVGSYVRDARAVAGALRRSRLIPRLRKRIKRDYRNFRRR